MSLRFMKTGKILATAKGSMSGGTLGLLFVFFWIFNSGGVLGFGIREVNGSFAVEGYA